MAVEKQTAQLIVELDQKSAKNAEQELKRISDTKLKLALDVGQLQQQMGVLKGQIKQAEKAGDFTASLKLRADAAILQRELTKAGRELTNFTRTGNKEVSVLGQLFENLGNKIGGTGGSVVHTLGLATGGMKQLISSALTAGGIAAIALGLQKIGNQALFLGDKFEQASIAFTTILGSGEKSRKLIADLSSFAKETPFEILGIQQTAKQLLAFGIEADSIIPTLNNLGNVASGTGTSLERIAYAYGQVRSAGKLYGTELRQFTEAGVPLLAELAKMYGVNEGAARQMVTDGVVGFADVEKAFANMSSEGGKFFDLMKKQSFSLTGRISNLKDSFNLLLASLGTALLPFAKGFATIGKFIIDNIVAVGVAVTGLAVLFGGPMILAIGAFLAPFSGIIAISAGVIAVLGGITYAIGSMGDSADTGGAKLGEMTSRMENLKVQSKNLKIALKEVEDEIKNLNQLYNSGSISMDEYKQEHSKLIDEQRLLENQLGMTKDAIKYTSEETKKHKEEIAELTMKQGELAFKKSQGMITEEEYRKGIEETNKQMRIAKGTTIEMMNANGDLVEVQMSLIMTQKGVQDALSKLSTAKSVDEFNKLRNEILATESALLRTRQLLAFNQTIDVLKLQANPLTDPKALERAKSLLKATQDVIVKSNQVTSAVNKSVFGNVGGGTKPAGGGGGGGGGKSSANEKLKEDLKEKDKLQEDSLKNARDVIKEEMKLQENLQKEYEETIKTLKKGLEDLASVTGKIDDLNKSTTEKIADRYSNITEKIADLQEKAREFTNEQRQLAESIGMDTLAGMDKNMNLSIGGGEISVGDLREYLKLQKELTALQTEQVLAKANTTDEAINATQESETQKILNEAEARRLDLEAERIEIEERIGFKEAEALKELEILEQKKLDNTEVINAYKDVVDTVEKQITAITKTETEARSALYAAEEANLRRLIALRLSAGVGNSSVAPISNIDNRTNSTSVIVNAKVDSSVDMNVLGKTLVKEINNSQKGIN